MAGSEFNLQEMAVETKKFLSQSVGLRAVTWREALDHFAQGGMPETPEQVEVAELLELLASSSVSDLVE